jgi:hypothetical protein
MFRQSGVAASETGSVAPMSFLTKSYMLWARTP